MFRHNNNGTAQGGGFYHNYYNIPQPKWKSKYMPPGIPHPAAGEILGPDTARCPCGGITGICGSPGGASKWRRHQRTDKHRTWDPIYNH